MHFLISKLRTVGFFVLFWEGVLAFISLTLKVLCFAEYIIDSNKRIIFRQKRWGESGILSDRLSGTVALITLFSQYIETEKQLTRWPYFCLVLLSVLGKLQVGRKIWLWFYLFFYLSMCVCLSVFTCTMGMQEPTKVRRVHQIPWNWRNRQLWTPGLFVFVLLR